uniref:Uncharacterized protein n=1 Tax=Cacopsylla melanoneura TaxID=428564 RepID=A0A8D8YSB0_9HEMI
MLRQIRGPVKILLPVLSHFSFIKEKEIIQLSKLIAIGCDGTNVNTGKNNGILKRIEQFGVLVTCQRIATPPSIPKLMGKLVPNNILVLQESQWKRARICLSLSLSGSQQHYTACGKGISDLSSDQQYLDICLAISSGSFPTSKLYFKKDFNCVVRITYYRRTPTAVISNPDILIISSPSYH